MNSGNGYFCYVIYDVIRSHPEKENFVYMVGA